MKIRLTLLAVGLATGCGSAASTPQGPSLSSDVGQNSASESGEPSSKATATASNSGTSLSESKAMAVLLFPEALKRGEEHWKKADQQKTIEAWDEAGEALALAAHASEDAPVTIKLLKGALAAWRNSDQLKSAGLREGGKSHARRALPLRETLRVAVLKKLAIVTDPADPDLAMIEYRHGRILWEFGHYQEAVQPLLLVVERFPANQEAKFASPLLLESLLLAGELKELGILAAKMLKNKKLVAAHPDLVETLQLVRHQASKKEARRLVESSSFRDCAESYMALYKRDKDLARVQADELLYNVSVCYERSKQSKRAIQTLRQLAKLYPRSQFADGAKERAEALEAQKIK